MEDFIRGITQITGRIVGGEIKDILESADSQTILFILKQIDPFFEIEIEGGVALQEVKKLI